MNAIREARLVGALQLVSGCDSIGVPVFAAENLLLVPEMDGEFKIIAFSEFFNEQGFVVTYQLPENYQGRLVRLGDPAPLPFWASQRCHVIEGDAEKAAVEAQFGVDAKINPALRDLGRMLDDARNGRVKARIAEWEAQDLASGFDDVLLEPPSRSRYWIARYRVALENARKVTQPPHPIDVRLRNAANQWLRKFAVKSDPSMLGGVLGSSAQGIFSTAQIRNIVFAYIVHKLAARHNAHLEAIFREDTATTIFSDGIYSYFLATGWPHVPFKYEHADLIEYMKEEINDGINKGNMDRAVRISRLLFGGRDAPREIDDHVMLYIGRAVELYKADNQHGREEYHQYPSSADMREWADKVLSRYNVLSQLSCIAHGKDRLAGEMAPGRFGISPEDVAEWRLWSGVRESIL